MPRQSLRERPPAGRYAMIRNVKAEDAEAICRIYNHYVVGTTVTFEEKPVSPEEMRDRIENVTAALPWIVWEDDGGVRGYAYAAPWKNRSAYRFSSESTIYLQPGFTGKGLGRDLYASLIPELRRRSLHSVIGGIALPNERSVALHERMGFRKIAHFEEVGWKFGQWIDVGYWELLLENAGPCTAR